jgi:hypothetical protein
MTDYPLDMVLFVIGLACWSFFMGFLYGVNYDRG